jgi:hypothetical protein
MINEDQANLLYDAFDRAMTQHLDTDPEGEFSISQGTTLDFRFIQSFYQVFLKPAIIKFPEGTYTSPALEIIAVNGKAEDAK